ncbi:MAG: hypothetical protein ACREQ3_17740 [Candidatus Binatia bacterium]
MDVEKELRALRLFLEAEARLWEYSYAQKIVNEPSGFNLSWDQDEGLSSTRSGPEGESIDAYVLTLRLFIQNNERVSIGNTTKNVEALFAKGIITKEQHDAWMEAREHLNKFLDSDTYLSVNKTPLSNRHVLDTVVYGGYAHYDERKRRELDSWKKIPSLFDMVMNEFVNITGRMNYWLHGMRGLVEEVVAEIERRQSSAR